MADDGLLTVRCSALPAAFACPGSVRTPAVAIDTSDEASVLGTAVHDALAEVVRRDLSSMGRLDLAAIAKRHGAVEKEMAPLVWYGIEAWKQLREGLPEAATEVPMRAIVGGDPDVWLTGTADVLALRGDEAAGLDWKSGRVDRDYEHQMRGYCALTLLTHPELQLVTVSPVWLREQEVETYRMNREGLARWLGELRRRVIRWDGVYHPGPVCTYCPRSHDCPAVVASTRRDIAILSADELTDDRIERGLAAMAPAEKVALLRRAKSVAVLCERVRAAIRQDVQRNGPLASGDGTELRLVQTQGTREIDALKAWPTLEAALSEEELAACIDVSIGAVEATVARKAPPGRGAAAKRAIADALEAAGAVSRTPVEQLREVRIPGPTENKTNGGDPT